MATDVGPMGLWPSDQIVNDQVRNITDGGRRKKNGVDKVCHMLKAIRGSCEDEAIYEFTTGGDIPIWDLQQASRKARQYYSYNRKREIVQKYSKTLDERWFIDWPLINAVVLSIIAITMKLHFIVVISLSDIQVRCLLAKGRPYVFRQQRSYSYDSTFVARKRELQMHMAAQRIWKVFYNRIAT